MRLIALLPMQNEVRNLKADVGTLQNGLSDRDGVIATDFQTMRDQRERISDLQNVSFVLRHKAQVRMRVMLHQHLHGWLIAHSHIINKCPRKCFWTVDQICRS